MGKRKRKQLLPAHTAASTTNHHLGSGGSTFVTPQGQEMPVALEKYWRGRYNFFWRFDEGIAIDEEGWYSVTPEAIAEDTAERIAQLHNKQLPNPSKKRATGYGRICVIDAFCGVGGNAIKFAEWCECVIAIDIDPGRLEMARHNAEIYGVADRIEFVLGDFYQLAPMLKADVVFMSPPWGGPEYTSAEVFDLDMMPFHSAQEWLDRARMVSKNIVYFMPRNCDPVQLADLYPGAPCEIELNYTRGFLKAITVYYNDVALVDEGDNSNSERRIYRRPTSEETQHVAQEKPELKRRASLAEKREELLGEMEGLRRRGVVPNSVEGVERLLKSQRATQEELTSDLVQMASVLKKNSVAFGDLIEKDKTVIEETSDLLNSNVAGVSGHGARLNKYRKRAWGTTGLTWLMILVVVSVFFLLVLFMRIAPKRY
ncbi:Trimethylguanosine synthase [Coemansia sp. RSA 2424]|nr:Trimethylguanosine synthase [Coemansia sp. RSA 2424]